MIPAFCLHKMSSWMQKPLTSASVYSNQYTAHSAVLGPRLQKKFSVQYEAWKIPCWWLLEILHFPVVNDKSSCVCVKFGTQVPTYSTSKLCSSAMWHQHDFFCGYVWPLSLCSISITTQHTGLSKLPMSLSHHTISPSCGINQELQRLTILPWTFHKFLLELICILSSYNPTNFASDLTQTFCLTVLVCLNSPTGIY
jgi:hypothetical protein